MDTALLELIERMEVRMNQVEEAQRQQALYDMGVQKMSETRVID